VVGLGEGRVEVGFVWGGLFGDGILRVAAVEVGEGRYPWLSQLLSPESPLSKAARSRCGLEDLMTACLVP
jgi:hypothetical protein